MRNLILQILSTLALLIYPLSLAAQNSFSLSLDVNSAAGDQAVTSVNVSANQVIAIQIFGKDIQNSNGLAVRFEYDVAQVVYEGFDAGDVLPNAQALPEQGTGYVEIGMASLGGQATVNSGLVGTVRFRTTAAFSGTAIRLVRAELSRSGRFETLMPNISIALQGAPPPATFSLSLDVDGAAGDQAVTSVDVSADEIVAIQIFGQDIRNANGVSIRFEYHVDQVTYEGFDAGDVLPNAQALPEQGTGYVEIGMVSLGGQATTNSGLVGIIRFRTTDAFSGTAIRLVRAELGRGGQITSATLDVRVELILQVLTPDFNGDGVVNFADFLAFAGQYGARQGDGRYEAKYDLDSDGAIGFGDFLIFGSSFGQNISTPNGGSSGGGSTTDVDIPDANLRAVIEDSLGKARGAPISRAEMATLTRLEAPDSDISDLTGLEFATNLTRLDLGEEYVAGDYFNSNHISDLAPLANLTNLTILDLNGNFAFSDVSPLANLNNLRILRLSNNFVKDLSPLSGLTNLTNLSLRGNAITDISPLSGLTNLTSLDLYNNNITDVSPLSGLTNLERLYLYNNNITDVSPLSGLTNLVSLGLGGNLISDISSLSGLTNLEGLFLGGNLISNVSPLSGLTNLTRLNLYDNTISDVSPISGLTNLTSLGLYGNTISNISHLSGLTNLSKLYLRNNSISDISSLANLTNLAEVGLRNNNISDISSLSSLTNLTRLWILDNTISDLAPLVANVGLGEGDYVNMRNNPLSDTSLNTHIPALQTRGVNVIFGASKPAVDEKEPRMPYPENEDIVNGEMP